MSARDDSNRGCNPSGPGVLPGLRLIINGRTVSSVTCTDSMSTGTCSSSLILLKRVWSILAVAATSAFSAFAGMLSYPAVLPTMIRLTVTLVSLIVGGPTSTGRSLVAASTMGMVKAAGGIKDS
ncbi:unnamed protein product [Schistosoma curassoni]|uniref:Secreted protein n=1 Tax=Schistosoma curassoni TaxID=6186 RepID=A0A183K113_9TREM|nr:unnamed protein product [Schistosoma curassoni]